MRLIDRFIKSIDEIVRKHNSEPYFGCAYGSYPNYSANPHSDIDYFVVQPDFNEDLFKSLRDYTITFHKDYNKPLDEEVPYENKLIVTTPVVQDAVSMNMFSIINGKIIIPPIEYTAEYLGGIEIQKRLLFNALTSPHLKFGNNNTLYQELKMRAEENLLLLAKNLVQKTNPTQQDLIHVLLYGPENQCGEGWLGYKIEREKTIRYLTKLVCQNYHK